MTLYIPNELISGKKQAINESKMTISFPEPAEILKRIADCDKDAVKDCLDTYGSLVWALTKKYTADEAEAELAVQEVFQDIWKYAARFDETKTDEATFISHIAYSKLIKRNNMPFTQ